MVICEIDCFRVRTAVEDGWLGSKSRDLSSWLQTSFTSFRRARRRKKWPSNGAERCAAPPVHRSTECSAPRASRRGNDNVGAHHGKFGAVLARSNRALTPGNPRRRHASNLASPLNFLSAVRREAAMSCHPRGRLPLERRRGQL